MSEQPSINLSAVGLMADTQSFLRAVANHQMTIARDDAEFRHLQFRRPDSTAYSFSITTFPGYLVMTGDMGAWTFSRLRDMFEFFRKRPDDRDQLCINPDYWAGKLVASDCNGRVVCGAEEYDSDLFRREIYRRAVGLCREAKEQGVDRDGRKDLIEQLKDVLEFVDDESSAFNSAGAFEFHHPALRRPLRLDDFWEVDCNSWRGHYIWACYAIVWAIQQYDAAKTAQASTEQSAEAVTHG